MAINFLLGYGERLMTKIDPPGGSGEKWQPYSLDRARERLTPRIRHVERTIAALPPGACPGNQAVAILTMHPSFLPKSDFPGAMLAEARLRAIGSREAQVIPEQQHPKILKKHGHPVAQPTAQLFVAGDRDEIAKLSRRVNSWEGSTAASKDFTKLEDVTIQDPADKIRVRKDEGKRTAWEIVLHVESPQNSDVIVEAFSVFATAMGAEVRTEKRIYNGGLCFVPLHAEESVVRKVAAFQQLRIARSMPRLRPIYRSIGSPKTFDCKLPTGGVIDPSQRCVIFDGGLPSGHGLDKWVRLIEPDGIGPPVPKFQEHGLGVTSAALFGPITKGEQLPRPYCHIDHYRVLDENTGRDTDDDDDDDYFDVLHRIKAVLEDRNRKYDFCNISLGPNWPVEDNEPHAWTTTLDECYAKQPILAFHAVGNSGENHRESGNARIQPPADCVNAVGVGSCDSMSAVWKRSPHSSIGPGRSPGFVKPDFLAFGGSERNPFFVLGTAQETAIPVIGTSFASPTGMRVGTGVRSHLG
ncbi:MAG: S8 family peptidase, partial [Planctomycetaceae bacterium]|nr:S8 family peptidase [Planctomycetaceae bacterium]